MRTKVVIACGAILCALLIAFTVKVNRDDGSYHPSNSSTSEAEATLPGQEIQTASIWSRIRLAKKTRADRVSDVAAAIQKYELQQSQLQHVFVAMSAPPEIPENASAEERDASLRAYAENRRQAALSNMAAVGKMEANRAELERSLGDEYPAFQRREMLEKSALPILLGVNLGMNSTDVSAVGETVVQAMYEHRDLTPDEMAIIKSKVPEAGHPDALLIIDAMIDRSRTNSLEQIMAIADARKFAGRQ